MYSFFTTPVEVQRLTYVNGKSNYSPVGNVPKGYLKPLSLNDGIEEGAFGRLYRFSTYIDTDIKEGDKLTVSSGVYEGSYTVKGTAPKQGLQEISYLQCLLSKG